MSAAFDSLPPDVQDALRRGKHEDAAHLLRKASGVALKSAQARIAYVVSQGIPAYQAPQQAANGPSGHGAQPAQGPPDLASIASTLIDMLRAAARKHAEARREQSQAAQKPPPSIQPADLMHPTDSSLSPGEQTGSDFGLLVMLVAVAIAVAAALFWFK